MSEHFITRTEAESDLLACAAFLAERIKSIDGHAEAMLAVIPLYLQKGDVDLAAELSNTVDDPFTRDRLLTLVAEKCADMADDDYALQLAEAVEDHGIRGQALERVALRQAARGEFDRAREIAGQLAHPDAVLAGIAINQANKGDDAAAAETIGQISFPGAAVTAFDEMALASLQRSDSAKAVEHLDNAVDQAGNIEQPEEKSRAYCDIGNAFIDAGRNDKAIESFNKAKATAESIGGVHRDSFLALAAQGFLRAGSLELADRTLDLVVDKTQIATTLLGFSRELWRKDERDEAIESLEESLAMLESQHERETRDSRARFRLFTQIAGQFAGFEKGERAIEVAENIKDDGEKTSALSQIAAILTMREEDEQARHALRAIGEDGDRVFALIGMGDAKEKNGDRAGALELLDEAAALADSVPQFVMRSLAYSNLADRFGRMEEDERFTAAIRQALETIAMIRDESARATSLASVSTVAHNLGLELPEEERVYLTQILSAR